MMKQYFSTIALTLALSGIAMVFAHEVAGQARPDPGRQVPKMLPRPQVKEIAAPPVEPGAKVIAYEMARQVREPQAVARRITGALGVLLGTDAAQAPSFDVLKTVVEGDKAGRWVRIENTPVLSKYQREYDEIRLIHEERDLIHDPASDIGEDGVRKMAETYLKQLGENGVIDPRLYSQAVMQLGNKMVGEGSVIEKPKPGRIVEYRITFRPRLNGFEMANAGLRLGILTSGQLVSLRMGGVTPAGEWQGDVLKSTVKGAEREVRISTKDLMARFYKQAQQEAEAQVAWSRIMYVMPEGKSKAVVEPMLIVSYTQKRQVVGQPVVSRRKMLAYSLTKPDAAPIDFDAPATKHEGTTITRQR